MGSETDGGAGRGRNTQGAGERVDPRVVVTRERVVAATLDLLTETGLGGLTIDDVSKRSGVAKTTIYRHWPDKTALVVDACLQMADGDAAAPDTGSLEGDVRAILTDLAELLVSARWSSILPSIVDAAERDPQIAEVHSRLQGQHSAPLHAALQRGVLRGELPPGADLDSIVAALRGPLYFRRWFSREPLDSDFVSLVVRCALAGGVGGRPGASRPRKKSGKKKPGKRDA